MTPRRTITFLGPVLGLGLAAGALATSCACWTLDLPAATTFVSSGLIENFGVALTASGPTELSLLPLPRLGFRNIRLNAGASDGPVLAEGGNLAVQLDLKSLLLGRIEPVSMTLDGTEIILPRGKDDDRWAGPLSRLSGRLAANNASHPRRVTLSRLTLNGSDQGAAQETTARDIELALSWPFWSDAAELSGSLTWKNETVRIAAAKLHPADLLTGAESPFAVHVVWTGGALGVAGRAALQGGWRASGEATFATASLPETLAWAGTDMALAPLVGDLAISTQFEARGEAIECPKMRVTTGDTVFDGAGSVEFSGRRPSIRATLDADQLNLGPLLAGALKVAGFDGESEDWGRRSLALKPLTGGDLDLRLSGDGARIGPLRFENLAASIMVREDSIEATLNRAGFDRGSLKGHLHLTTAHEEGEDVTEVRANGVFDGLDPSTLLVSLGQSGWVLGSAQGAFTLQGVGQDAASLVRRLSGQVALSVGNGTLTGLDLAEMATRKGGKAQAPAARRNGRTPFDRVGVTLKMREGIAEITEGLMSGHAANAVLSGRVSLPERNIAARAELLPRGAASNGRNAATGPLFEIAGPWSAVSVTDLEPDARMGSDPMQPSMAHDLPIEVRAYAP